MLQKSYPESINETGGFFPNIGDKVRDNIICCGIEPKTSTSLHISNPKNVKQKMLNVLKTLTISDLLNMNTQSINNFIINKFVTKIDDGFISGIRIHRLRTYSEDIKLIDTQLQGILDNLHNHYSVYIKQKYNDLLPVIGKDTTIDILKKYYVYADDDNIRHKINLKSAVYLLEFEITSRESTKLGDKLANTLN